MTRAGGESGGGDEPGDEVSRVSLWLLRLATVAVTLVVLWFVIDAVAG